jgi:hypothetical protein
MRAEGTEQAETEKPRVIAVLHEFFWLSRRLAAQKAATMDQEGWSEFTLARSSLTQGDLLRASQAHPNPAVLLYRAAARLLIRAHLARAGLKSELSEAPDYWQSLRELPAGTELIARMTEEQSELAAIGLGTHGESLLSQMPLVRSREAARTLREISLSLKAPFVKHALLVRRTLIARWIRTGTVLMLLLAAATVAVSAATHRPNLALHRSVNVPDVDAEYADTSKLVDGNRSNLGFHVSGRSHTATIDLGSAQPISKVVVYNRNDCCQERAVPLKIEVAEKKDFKEVAERKSVFGVWHATFPVVTARYVRLTSKNQSPFHLSEVEVY